MYLGHTTLEVLVCYYVKKGHQMECQLYNIMIFATVMLCSFTLYPNVVNVDM